MTIAHARARVRSPVHVPGICPSGYCRTCVRDALEKQLRPT